MALPLRSLIYKDGDSGDAKAAQKITPLLWITPPAMRIDRATPSIKQCRAIEALPLRYRAAARDTSASRADTFRYPIVIRC